MLTITRASQAGSPRPNHLISVSARSPTGPIYVASLEAGAEVVHRLGQAGTALVYVVNGAASVDREDLAAGDSARATEEFEITIRAWQAATVVLVESRDGESDSIQAAGGVCVP